MSVLSGSWEVLDVGAPGWELGEGARSTSRGLVAVDLLAGRLFEVDIEQRTVRCVLEVDGPLGAVAPVEGSRDWIAAVDTGVALLGSDGPRWLGRPGAEGPVPLRVNDAVCDPRGRLWVGTMAWDTTVGAGALYRVDTDGVVRPVLEDLTIPNGPAFSADGSTMYLADSTAGTVYRCDVDDAGDVRSAAVLATVAEGSPDGMTVDEQGNLWFAVWGAGEVRRVSPDGTPLETLQVPARQPTSVALHAGHVVVTTATHGLDRPGPADGSILLAPCSVGASPTPSFRPGWPMADPPD